MCMTLCVGRRSWLSQQWNGNLGLWDEEWDDDWDEEEEVNQENKEKERVGSVEESTKTTSEATIATVDNMGHRI